MKIPADLIEELESTALFRGMTREEIKEALSSLGCVQREYKKGSTILRAGETTGSTGIVLDGSITIENTDIWGNRTILNIVGQKGFFAETYAVLHDEKLMINVCANEDCRILFIRIEDESFREPGSWQFHFLFNLMTISARKNLELSGRAINTSPKNIRGRVMSFLNFSAVRNGSTEFDIPFDRQQMADYLNVERTALSKELSRMKDDDLIKYRKNHFTVLGTNEKI